MTEETTVRPSNELIVNTNGYTIQRVLDDKEHIPVNEDNIMDLTSAYVDEDELKTALVPYTTSQSEGVCHEGEYNVECGDHSRVRYEKRTRVGGFCGNRLCVLCFHI